MRPDWDEYFMGIAQTVARRSNCVSRQVAAVLVKGRRIISTGYNGTPSGLTNCDEGGCPRCNSSTPSGKDLDKCLCSHAEENAIIQAAYHGTAVAGSTLYSTLYPCLTCTKMIINGGIKRVVYAEDYNQETLSVELLEKAGIEVRKL